MDLVEYKNKKYPRFQTIGNASQFAIPFAKYFCQGHGYDIGCNRVEWAYPGAVPIDPLILTATMPTTCLWVKLTTYSAAIV